MPQNEQALELQRLFKTLVKKVTEEWNKRSDNILSLAQFRLLYILSDQGQQKVAELAEKMQVTPGAITGMADKLIVRGFAERKRDEKDRRVVYLLITEQGRTLLMTLVGEQKELYSKIVDQLAAEDVQHMKRILTQMIHLLETIDKEH